MYKHSNFVSVLSKKIWKTHSKVDTLAKLSWLPYVPKNEKVQIHSMLGIYNFGWSQEVGILFFAKRGTHTYLLCPMQKYVLCSTKKEGWTNKIAAILEGLRISRWLLFLACKQSRQQQNSSFLFECLFILFGIPELLLHTVKHVCFSLNFIGNNCFVYCIRAAYYSQVQG